MVAGDARPYYLIRMGSQHTARVALIQEDGSAGEPHSVAKDSVSNITLLAGSRVSRTPRVGASVVQLIPEIPVFPLSQESGDFAPVPQGAGVVMIPEDWHFPMELPVGVLCLEGEEGAEGEGEASS